MRKSRGVTTYSGAHQNVTLRRGKAVVHQCECGKRADEWALVHDAPGVVTNDRGQSFSTDPSDYKPMCLRCHRIYDKSVITHCSQGHPYEGENVLMDQGKRKCRECHYERVRVRGRARTRRATPEDRERRNEYQRAYRARKQAQLLSYIESEVAA